jgi:hypothetical protein
MTTQKTTKIRSGALLAGMNPCCERLAEFTCKKETPLRTDTCGVTFLVSGMEGHTMEQVISYCPFCGKDISIKDTHRLEDVLSADSEFQIRFADGTEMVVKDCHPIDFSIYHRTGGWTGSVVEFSGSEKQIRFFKSGSGIDFHEEDILSIRNNQTGKTVYQRKSA